MSDIDLIKVLEKTVQDKNLTRFQVEDIYSAITLIKKQRHQLEATTLGATKIVISILNQFGYLPEAAKAAGWKIEPNICEHDWKDAKNEHVTGGEICIKCFDVRPTPSVSETGENDG